MPANADSEPMRQMNTKPNYGIDAPGVIRNLFVAALVVFLVTTFFPAVTIASITFVIRPMRWNVSLPLAIAGILMVVYVKWGKFRHRDRMISLVPWTGKEMVLDVGTGRGLLMIGAAKKLTTGKSIGIDIWSAKDLSGNRPENALRNAELEGVADRIEVRSEDATKMSFPDNTFDVILSNVCIHNIPSREGRNTACREIARVLKPGGVALISDFIHLGQYTAAFRKAGANAQRAGWFFVDTFPPMGILKVTKN